MRRLFIDTNEVCDERYDEGILAPLSRHKQIEFTKPADEALFFLVPHLDAEDAGNDVLLLTVELDGLPRPNTFPMAEHSRKVAERDRIGFFIEHFFPGDELFDLPDIVFDVFVEILRTVFDVTNVVGDPFEHSRRPSIVFPLHHLAERIILALCVCRFQARPRPCLGREPQLIGKADAECGIVVPLLDVWIGFEHILGISVLVLAALVHEIGAWIFFERRVRFVGGHFGAAI